MMKDIALATSIMEIVVQRMMRAYPFYAAIVSGGTFRAEAVGTLAVTIRAGQLTFLFDPRFVVTHSLDEVAAGVHHEIMHVLHGHLTADRSRFPDSEARVVAEEVTCNEFIKEPLPAGVLRHAQFGLPDDEDTDTRYERLAKTNPARNGQNSVPERANCGQRQTDSVPATQISFDDHSFWPEGEVAATGAAVIGKVVATAIAQVNPVAWSQVPSSIRAKANAIAGLGRSTYNIRSNQIAPASARLNWERLLARVIQQRTDREATFSRANRRFPHLIGIVPGTRLTSTHPRILAVVDSSGSVTDGMLASISAELTALARVACVTVCECDTRIQRTYAYNGPVTTVVGRGGTDLRPPFAPAYLQDQRPDAVVVFSDGHGPAPEAPPRVPVIWVVMAGGRVPANWGQAVPL